MSAQDEALEKAEREIKRLTRDLSVLASDYGGLKNRHQMVIAHSEKVETELRISDHEGWTALSEPLAW